MSQGTPRAEDFTSDFWKAEVLPNLTRAQVEFKRFGELLSTTLVEREKTKGLHSYRYRLEFANATGMLHLVLDAQDKVTVFSGEDLEWRPAAKSPKPQSP